MTKQAISHECRVCGVELTNENWASSYPKNRIYICKECHGKQSRLWREVNVGKAREIRTRCERNHGVRSYNENETCSMFLGIHIAERVLSHVFNGVERMPMNNPGYDFICNHGKKIDVKSSCLQKNGWSFAIKRNIIADYFLCIAFDNREDLNPLHLWLLPRNGFSHLTGVSIRLTTIHKFNEYKLDVTKISTCCNMLKESI